MQKDLLEIEPSWKDLVQGLNNKEQSRTCAKLIVYAVSYGMPISYRSDKGMSAGETVNSFREFEKDRTEKNPVRITKTKSIIKAVRSQFGRKVARRVKSILREDMFSKNNIDKITFYRKNINELRYGEVPGIKGEWRKRAEGGTWAIYTSRNSAKILKAPHKVENNWQGALLTLTHEKVAREIEENYSHSPLSPPKNHDIAIVNVNGARIAIAIMDYEHNYVRPSCNKKGFDKSINLLKHMYDKGDLPAYEFDYDSKGLKRKNLAYRNGEFIALDLCDASVLKQEKFLKEKGILDKARQLGFSPTNKSLFTKIFDRFI